MQEDVMSGSHCPRMTTPKQKTQGSEPEAGGSRTETYARTFQAISTFNSVEIPSAANGLDLSGNPILSFRGFPGQSFLVFSAIDTPLSDLPNFRHLALIAIGTQLKTLNGVAVTAQERARAQERLKQFRECLRSGYLCARWPRRLPLVLDAAASQNDNPITVRILKVVRLAGKPESTADPILERLFAPALPKAKVGNQQTADERLTKQEVLIEFMSTQIKELADARKQKLGALKGKTTVKKQRPGLCPAARARRTIYLWRLGRGNSERTMQK
jgi:hypothetical protein